MRCLRSSSPEAGLNVRADERGVPELTGGLAGDQVASELVGEPRTSPRGTARALSGPHNCSSQDSRWSLLRGCLAK